MKMYANNFFLKTDIDSELLCGSCNVRYDVPKNLPCGNSICTRCENHFFQKIATKLCPICGTKHNMPMNGFPISVFIQKLLDKPPVLVYRGETHQNALDQIDRFHRNFKDFQNDLKSSPKIINFYCKILKANVEKKYESVLERIKNYQQEIIDQINNYEKKCIQNSDNLIEFDEFANDCHKKAKEWRNFINQPLVKEAELKKISNELMKLKKELDMHRKRFEKLIFDHKRLQFFESKILIEPRIIGVLSKTSFLANSFKHLIDGSLKRVNFNQDNNFINCCYAWETETNTYCMVGIVEENIGAKTYTIILQLMSIDGELIKEVRGDSLSNRLYAAKLNNIIFVVHRESNLTAILLSFDTSLNLKNSVDIKYPPTSCYIHNNQLHIFSSSTSKLFTYDTNLCLITSQSVNRNLYGANQNLSAIQHNKVYTLTPFQLSIYDFETQELLMNFKFNQMDSNINSYIIYPLTEDSFLLILRNGEFRVFDIEQTCLMEFNVDFAKEISGFCISDTGVIFVLTTNGILHIYG